MDYKEKKWVSEDPERNFKLILVDINVAVCTAFEKYFKKFPNVKIVHAPFETLEEFDCMVSAANSFGLMDGGIDGAITEFFGKQLPERVQNYILTHFDGEQPVGTSFIIETNNSKHPYLAHTPTMRVPQSIRGTDNVYLAMKAMLRAVYNFNKNARKIETVACPGLGTFFGRMDPDEAARQMCLAYQNFLFPPREISWSLAIERQEEIMYTGEKGKLLDDEKTSTRPKQSLK